MISDFCPAALTGEHNPFTRPGRACSWCGWWVPDPNAAPDTDYWTRRRQLEEAVSDE